MTTNTNPRRNIDHATCGHPLTKAARAICRRAHRSNGPVPQAIILGTERGEQYADLRGTATLPMTYGPLPDVHFTWLQGPAPVTRPTYEPCTCTGKPKGFHADDNEVWVCVTCDKPTAMYLKALGLDV